MECCKSCKCCASLLQRIDELEKRLHVQSAKAHVRGSGESQLDSFAEYQGDEEMNGMDSSLTDRHIMNGKDHADGSMESASEESDAEVLFTKCDLSNEEILRYSRQMILPEVTSSGQIRLKHSSVLIVGAGGLGCPSSLYLAAAGVGHIGLVDYDIVDTSNLHRQVLHKEGSTGMSKVESAIKELKMLNSTVRYTAHHTPLSSSNALEILSNYDIILDCTDNVATRYLLNDASVLAKKPLVSGSALRFDGQLTVYNYNNGPCYRCLYPTPPPAETVTNCSDGGVLGAVTGVIGSLQALEAIKMITGGNSSFSSHMLLFDGLSGAIRKIKLRGKKEECPMCGVSPSIDKLQDYEEFCGASATDKTKCLKLLPRTARVSAREFAALHVNVPDKMLLDVRSEAEYGICSLKGSINVPIEKLLNSKFDDELLSLIQGRSKTFVICRQGNDSQKAVTRLNQLIYDGSDKNTNTDIKDIIGGLTAWTRQVECDFPIY